MTASLENRFDQPQVWGHVHEQPRIRLKTDVFLATIPEGVRTIVDIGCGDGAITNRLGERYRVTGVDASAEALTHVTVDSILAQAESLPFPDRCFDLALCSEMLEHLEDDAYRSALGEICRVARRYVLISVPYREDLRWRSIRCPACGWRGHVWGHRRSFTTESLIGALRGFRALDVRIFGDWQTPPWPPPLLWALQHLLRAHYDPTGQSPVCERCGNTDFGPARVIGARSERLKGVIDKRRPRPGLPFWLAVLAERED